jgi:hypothetical protein
MHSAGLYRPLALLYRSGVFPLLFRRRLPVLNLTARYVDHELGELGRVARAFQGLVGHL